MLGGCRSRIGTNRKSRHAQGAAVDADIPVKGIKHTNLDEAIRCKNFYKEQGDEDLAAKYLEHALTLAKDHKVLSQLTLELADLYMDMEKRDKASKYYNQYKMFYPGSSHIKYVLFQELKATELDSLESDKDQTKTKAALKLGQHYLADFPDDSEYAQATKDVMQRCYQKLTKSELQAASFYVNKFYYELKDSALKAAHKRIEFLLKEYAYHLDRGEELLGIGSKIITTPIEAYLGSLEAVIEQLQEFMERHEDAQQEGFLSKLLGTQRHGRSKERARE
jgi:outer membrane assembly lipoprotein YfiO